MRPLDIDKIGPDLAIKWEDDTESYIPLEKLRRACPCAGCKGETDIMGNLYKPPDKPYPESAFILRSWIAVGTYGIQPLWGDGHSTGIFTFNYLRELA